MSKKKQKANKEKRIVSKEKRMRKRRIKMVFQSLFLLGLISMLIVMGVFYHKYGRDIIGLQKSAKEAVRKSDESAFKSAQTSLIYDKNEKLILAVKSEKEVYYLKFDDIPKEVVDAMVVTEDRKFLDHGGIDFIANIRAALTLLKNKGEVTQGASTITQQLARNVFLTHQVTYERKIEELFVAQELEKKYSKRQIMEFYLNNIYFANGYYGIQAASKGYFNKSANKLSLSQMAFLCSIPNNPTVYNPITNMENTLVRRDRVLKQMFEEEKITASEYNEAIDEKIKIKKKKKKDKNNSVETYVHYSAIRALMSEKGFNFRNVFDSEDDKEKYYEEYNALYNSCQQDLYSQGYRIYTSLDMDMQKQLQTTVQEGLKGHDEVNDEGIFKLQGAAVCIDNETGNVVALVGSREQDVDGFPLNRAYQAFRQPGSAIKPLIVYAPILERGYTPGSYVEDKKFDGGPRNSDHIYRGNIPIKEAVARSSNTIAWKLYEELTPAKGLSYILNMGFSRIVADDYYPATSLGGFTIGVSAMEMAAAFSTLENDGYYREPTCITKITSADGKTIYMSGGESKMVYDISAARMTTESLKEVIHGPVGTGRSLRLNHTVSAGKTGTTDDKKDGWFVGYTPYYTTSVWVGYDTPKTLNDLYGATYPGRIWRDFMNLIHDDTMTMQFETYKWKVDKPKEPEVKEEDLEEDIEEIEEIEEIEDIEDVTDDDPIEDDIIIPPKDDEDDGFEDDHNEGDLDDDLEDEDPDDSKNDFDDD